MESIPVSGVEMRNEVVAPLLAPPRRSAMAVGITEHEHKGMGTPNNEARPTERKSSLPSLPRNIPWTQPVAQREVSCHQFKGTADSQLWNAKRLR